jgi:tRNA-dihydrouridine synthase
VQDIFRMIAYAGVSGVSVARGCIGNPWIFTQARRMMAGLPPGTPSLDEQRSVLMQHFELAVQLNGEKHASRLMRKFGIRFASHHPEGEQVRQAMIAVSNLGDWHAMMERFYPVTQRA